MTRVPKRGRTTVLTVSQANSNFSSFGVVSVTLFRVLDELKETAEDALERARGAEKKPELWKHARATLSTWSGDCAVIENHFTKPDH